MALAEPGCRHYAWTAAPHLPGRVHVFEQWDSAAELQEHLEGEAYRGMLGHLSGDSILSAQTRKYRCDLVEPVYGPDGVATATFLTAKD
jgi:quinol monooxygenase YgiN